MIKANELRRGNKLLLFGKRIVTFNGVISYVSIEKDRTKTNKEAAFFEEEYEATVDLNVILGIPVTEEWLIKFGFKKATELMDFNEGSEIHVGFGKKIDDFTYLLIGSNGVTLCDSEDLHVILLPEKKYVHELQNLYFALTGEELTINDNNKNQTLTK